MHPPFYVVDHKVGPDNHYAHDYRPARRRGAPTRLELRPSAAGWPPIPLVPGAFADNSALQLPIGATLPPQTTLFVVPPPQRKLRNVIGRFLIRAGQRMIMENRV